MGPAKNFELSNSIVAPASDAALVDALIAFANGLEVVIYRQRPSLGQVRRWSLWREAPSPDERAAHVNFLHRLMEVPGGYMGYTTDASGQRRPTNAAIEIPALPRPTGERDLLPDRDFFSWLAHMGASMEHQPVLVAHRQGYSLTEFRSFQNVASALAVGMLLVMDPVRPFAKALCRCKWCQAFYLARKNPKGGPANRIYCSPKHRDNHHDSGARRATEKAARKHR
jgi:hypothetical protein